jgi:hypothetical protein
LQLYREKQNLSRCKGVWWKGSGYKV